MAFDINRGEEMQKMCRIVAANLSENSSISRKLSSGQITGVG